MSGNLVFENTSRFAIVENIVESHLTTLHAFFDHQESHITNMAIKVFVLSKNATLLTITDGVHRCFAEFQAEGTVNEGDEIEIARAQRDDIGINGKLQFAFQFKMLMCGNYRRQANFDPHF